MSFSLDISKFVGKANKNVELVVRKIVLDIASEVVSRSPVDTGRFRGNWDYGFNIPISGTYTSTDKTGEATLDRINSRLSMSGVSGVHYLVNNLPYAQRLEEGYSQQAPLGIIGLTVVKWQPIVDNAARDMA